MWDAVRGVVEQAKDKPPNGTRALVIRETIQRRIDELAADGVILAGRVWIDHTHQAVGERLNGKLRIELEIQYLPGL